LNAGFETAEVDIAGEKLSFLPRRRPETGNESPAPAGPVESAPDGTLPLGGHPAWGAMKGTFKVPPEIDLTLPATRHWAEIYDPDQPVKRDER
jgi:hypothetical protein